MAERENIGERDGRDREFDTGGVDSPYKITERRRNDSTAHG
jgi:hypothetical protein